MYQEKNSAPIFRLAKQQMKASNVANMSTQLTLLIHVATELFSSVELLRFYNLLTLQILPRFHHLPLILLEEEKNYYAETLSANT